MVFVARQEPFICEHCGNDVTPLERGSYRNHCPNCLWGKHVDDKGPGDRAADCGGLMQPIALEQHPKKGITIRHRCLTCGKTIPNKVAPDDQLAAFTLES